MASELTTYTKAHHIHNMEVTDDLSTTNPENYVAQVSPEGQRTTAIMNVPLKNMVKIYLESPEKS